MQNTKQYIVNLLEVKSKEWKKKTIKDTVKETFFQNANEFEFIFFFRKFFFCRELKQLSTTECVHVCVKCSRKWHRIINSEIHTFKDITKLQRLKSPCATQGHTI